MTKTKKFGELVIIRIGVVIGAPYFLITLIFKKIFSIPERKIKTLSFFPFLISAISVLIYTIYVISKVEGCHGLCGLAVVNIGSYGLFTILYFAIIGICYFLYLKYREKFIEIIKYFIILLFNIILLFYLFHHFHNLFNRSMYTACNTGNTELLNKFLPYNKDLFNYTFNIPRGIYHSGFLGNSEVSNCLDTALSSDSMDNKSNFIQYLITNGAICREDYLGYIYDQENIYMQDLFFHCTEDFSSWWYLFSNPKLKIGNDSYSIKYQKTTIDKFEKKFGIDFDVFIKEFNEIEYWEIYEGEDYFEYRKKLH